MARTFRVAGGRRSATTRRPPTPPSAGAGEVVGVGPGDDSVNGGVLGLIEDIEGEVDRVGGVLLGLVRVAFRPPDIPLGTSLIRGGALLGEPPVHRRAQGTPVLLHLGLLLRALRGSLG